MSQKKLENMTDDELMDSWTKAAEDLESAKEWVREFSQEHQRRSTDQEAERVLESMNDKQRAALLQKLEAEGVESEESVNY